MGPAGGPILVKIWACSRPTSAYSIWADSHKLLQRHGVSQARIGDDRGATGPTEQQPRRRPGLMGAQATARPARRPLRPSHNCWLLAPAVLLRGFVFLTSANRPSGPPLFRAVKAQAAALVASSAAAAAAAGLGLPSAQVAELFGSMGLSLGGGTAFGGAGKSKKARKRRTQKRPKKRSLKFFLQRSEIAACLPTVPTQRGPMSSR